MKSVVLFSGGIDSTTIIYKLLKETDDIVYPLNFNYGQKQHAHEITSMQNVIEALDSTYGHRLKPLKTIDISHIDIFKSSLVQDTLQLNETYTDHKEKDTTNVPFRTVIFASMGAAYTDMVGADEIWTGNHRANDEIQASHYDSNPEALFKLAILIQIGSNYAIEFKTPFAKLFKKDIFVIAKSLDVPFDLTWSCYSGEDKPCGKCRACYERSNGLKEAGIIINK